MKIIIQFKFLKYTFFFSALIFSASSFAYDPYDCLNDVAKIDTKIPIGLATQLCSATWSSEPVICYAGTSLVDKEMPRGLAIELCAGSVDAKKTLECYAKSGNRKLNRGLATTLCGANKIKN